MFNTCHLNQPEVVDTAHKLSLSHKILKEKMMVAWMDL